MQEQIAPPISFEQQLQERLTAAERDKATAVELARAQAMALALHRRGVLTKLRQSAGQSVDGGCGQLRARALPAEQPVRFV